jgi:manganese/iron transport system permease protein/iron/zinc/copper transport system permease protein
MDTLLDPFRYDFFNHALIVATLAGALCGLVGVYVVLRGMSYIGHGLSHAMFGGVAAAIAINISFLFGGIVTGLVSAWLILGIARRRSIGADAAIGVITSSAFALGIVVLVAHPSGQNIDALLFGNVLGVELSEVVVVAGVAVVAAAVVFGLYRRLLFSTFDPEVADVSGVSTVRMDMVLALLLTAVIAVCMNVLGVTLIAAMLVIPPVIGRLLTDSFHRMMWISVGTGAACGLVGVYLSFYLDWPSGPAVVLTAAAVFAVAYVVSALRKRAIPVVALDAHVG